MVKINRQKRRQLHAIWPPLVMGPMYRVASEMQYYIRKGIWGDGLTPKERDYLYSLLKELDEVTKKLCDFYYQRLKY
jgi:hypothetical protein